MIDKIKELIPTHIPSASEVKALRDSLQLSQPVFADAFNISMRTLQRYERGASRMDAYMWEYMNQIAKAVRVEPVIYEVPAKPKVDIDDWL